MEYTYVYYAAEHPGILSKRWAWGRSGSTGPKGRGKKRDRNDGYNRQRETMPTRQFARQPQSPGSGAPACRHRPDRGGGSNRPWCEPGGLALHIRSKQAGPVAALLRQDIGRGAGPTRRAPLLQNPASAAVAVRRAVSARRWILCAGKGDASLYENELPG